MDFFGSELPPIELELDDDTAVLYGGDPPLGRGATSTVYPGLLRRKAEGGVIVSRAVLRQATYRSPEEKAVLDQEVEVWKNIPPHANVLGFIGQLVYRPNRRSPFSFLSVTERLDGDLQDLIFDDALFAAECTFADMLQILKDICTGLKHLHTNNIVHLDLKPSNVLVSNGVQDYIVKLADFGASKAIEVDKTSITAIRQGTLAFMAPEVLSAPLFAQSQIRYKRAVDVYSLGVLMWVLINRAKVNAQVNETDMGRRITWGQLTEPKIVWCAAPPQLCDLIEGCLKYHDGEEASSAYGRPSVTNIMEILQALENEPWVQKRVPKYLQDEGHDKPTAATIESYIGQVQALKAKVEALMTPKVKIEQTSQPILSTQESTGQSLSPSPQDNEDLMNAALSGNTDEVKRLLTKGGNVQATDDIGRTALYKASWMGHLGVVKTLLDAGAKVDFHRQGGFTALYAACDNGNSEVVKLLIHAGADLNSPTDKGSTPLIIASQEGQLGVVELLINAGAQLNIRGRGGQTALYFAAKKGHVGIVKALINAGADVNIPDVDKISALQTSVKRHGAHSPVVAILKDAGATTQSTMGFLKRLFQ